MFNFKHTNSPAELSGTAPMLKVKCMLKCFARSGIEQSAPCRMESLLFLYSALGSPCPLPVLSPVAELDREQPAEEDKGNGEK